MIKSPLTSTSANIASALSLLKPPLKNALAFSGVKKSLLPLSMAWKSCSHLFQESLESLHKRGRFGKVDDMLALDAVDALLFCTVLDVLRPSFQSTQAAPFI